MVSLITETHVIEKAVTVLGLGSEDQELKHSNKKPSAVRNNSVLCEYQMPWIKK